MIVMPDMSLASRKTQLDSLVIATIDAPQPDRFRETGPFDQPEALQLRMKDCFKRGLCPKLTRMSTHSYSVLLSLP